MNAAGAPQPIEPMRGGRLAWMAVTLGAASFMQVVDTTIANVSVPTISGNLGVSANVGEWLITSFAISNAIVTPLTGWLSQRFGQVRLFLAAVTLFTIASVLCGLAPTFSLLLGARVVQGVVCGPMVPLSQALLIACFPPQQRTFAVAMWAMTNMTGPLVGPMLGGWLTDHFHWSWIFLVNTPVGIVIAISTFLILRGRETVIRTVPVDAAGLVFLSLAVGSLQILLDRGRFLDWFASPAIMVLAIVAVASFVALIVWELDEAHPVIDLRLFTFRNYAAATAAISVGFGLFFAAMVLIPLWLQTDMQYSSTWAGIAVAPLGILGVVLAPFIGRSINGRDPRPFASVAFVVWASVALWRSCVTTDVSMTLVAGMCLAQGLGIAFFLTPLVSLSLIGIPAERIAAATGLQTAVRFASGSLGSSIAVSFWEHRARAHQNYLVDTLTGPAQSVPDSLQPMLHHGFSFQQVWGVIEQTAQTQADMLALNDFFLFSAVLFASALGLVWLGRYRKTA